MEKVGAEGKIDSVAPKIKESSIAQETKTGTVDQRSEYLKYIEVDFTLSQIPLSDVRYLEIRALIMEELCDYLNLLLSNENPPTMLIRKLFQKKLGQIRFEICKEGLIKRINAYRGEWFQAMKALNSVHVRTKIEDQLTRFYSLICQVYMESHTEKGKSIQKLLMKFYYWDGDYQGNSSEDDNEGDEDDTENFGFVYDGKYREPLWHEFDE